jgi:hypothetical protein
MMGILKLENIEKSSTWNIYVRHVEECKEGNYPHTVVYLTFV